MRDEFYVDPERSDPEPDATVVTKQDRHQRALGITETVEYPADAELGESVEFYVDGGRVEAFLSDNVIVLDPHEPDARFALRAYAFAMARRGQTAEAKALLRRIGREG